jgi:RHS repeat-associated protein
MDGSNNLQTRYVRGEAVDQIFARVSSGGTAAWYLTDRLGSVQNLTDASGTVQDTLAYDGWGNVTSESNAGFGDRYKWTGREYDSNTGLQYDRTRYYDSESGRWTSDDPLGFSAGDSNLYRYVTNETTSFSDPSGLQAVKQDAKIKVTITDTGKDFLGKFPLGPYADGKSAGYGFGVTIDFPAGKKKDVKVEQKVWLLTYTRSKKPKSIDPSLGPTFVVATLTNKDYPNGKSFLPKADTIVSAMMAWNDKKLTLNDLVDDKSQIINSWLQGKENASNEKVTDSQFQYWDMPGHAGTFIPSIMFDAEKYTEYQMYAFFSITASCEKEKDTKTLGFQVVFLSDGKTWEVKGSKPWNPIAG